MISFRAWSPERALKNRDFSSKRLAASVFLDLGPTFHVIQKQTVFFICFASLDPIIGKSNKVYVHNLANGTGKGKELYVINKSNKTKTKRGGIGSWTLMLSGAKWSNEIKSCGIIILNATVILRDYLVGLKNRPWSVIFLQIQDFFKHFTSLIKILEHCCMITALEFGSSSGWWSRITFPISVHMNVSRGLKTVEKKLGVKTLKK